LGLIGAAVVIGAANTVVLKLFLGAVDAGTTDLWDDVFHTDEHRWVVVPLALVAAMPPRDASAPGSTGKKRPC